MNSSQSDNDGRHIDKIVGAVGCSRHAADIGDACWNLPTARGIMRAICNRRARSAGARGQVTQDPKHGNAPVYTNKKDYR